MLLQIDILLLSKRSISGSLSCYLKYLSVISAASPEVTDLIRWKRVLHCSMESFLTAAIDRISLRV
jgi:hypothetical protein